MTIIIMSEEKTL